MLLCSERTWSKSNFSFNRQFLCFCWILSFSVREKNCKIMKLYSNVKEKNSIYSQFVFSYINFPFVINEEILYLEFLDNWKWNISFKKTSEWINVISYWLWIFYRYENWKIERWKMRIKMHFNRSRMLSFALWKLSFVKSEKKCHEDKKKSWNEKWK